MSKVSVSIVIVSFNTKDLLSNCLDSLKDVSKEMSFEVIISDNGSTDGTIEFVKHYAKKSTFAIILLENIANLGFAKANNCARSIAKGEYVLFLNPDTIVHPGALTSSRSYLHNNSNVGAVTCKVVLPDGTLDRDTRRRFPTPFISLSHFSYLDRLFPKSVFDTYWYNDTSPETTHDIEAMQGAYFFARKSVLDLVDWFDTDYFLDGEDIDLSFKIHEAGYRLVYNPEATILHIKKGSKSKNRSLRSVVGGVEAMKLFYKKRLWSRYSLPVNMLVIFGITCMKYLRTALYYLS